MTQATYEINTTAYKVESNRLEPATNDYWNTPEIIEVTDSKYFYMIDNQVRTAMKKFETEVCLPKAKAVLEKSGIKVEELKEFPTEGYYYETEELRLYMKILRNLQHHRDLYLRVSECEELDFLRKVCHNDLFGIEDPYSRFSDAPLKRRYDIMTITMEDTKEFNPVGAHPWSIPEIMRVLTKWYDNRTNLVELAYLTGDPKCLCCGAETNALYRMFACLTGSFSLGPRPYKTVWKVRPEVEDLGRKIVLAYNTLVNDPYAIQIPTPDNQYHIKKTPKLPRVAVLGYLIESEEYYHWILDEQENLTELYSKDLITTEAFEKKNLKTGWRGNIFRATPVPEQPKE